MQSADIKANRDYHKPKGIYGGTIYHLADNHLNREFEISKPNHWWVSDFTYIKTQGGLCLAVVLDLFSRKIVGGSMSHHMTEDLILSLLRRHILAKSRKELLIYTQIKDRNTYLVIAKSYWKH